MQRSITVNMRQPLHAFSCSLLWGGVSLKSEMLCFFPCGLLIFGWGSTVTICCRNIYIIWIWLLHLLQELSRLLDSLFQDLRILWSYPNTTTLIQCQIPTLILAPPLPMTRAAGTTGRKMWQGTLDHWKKGESFRNIGSIGTVNHEQHIYIYSICIYAKWSICG